MGRWHMAVVFLALVVLTAIAWLPPRMLARATSVAVCLITVAVCGFWRLHLHCRGLPRPWSPLYAALLAALWLEPLLLRRGATLILWLGALGCAIFVYAMLWVFQMHENEPGLRPLASAALLLSIGILAKPAVLVGCVLLSVIFFLGRRRIGSVLQSALLLLTPVLLCALALVLLSTIPGFAQIGWASAASADLYVPGSRASGQQLAMVWVGLTALITRLLSRKSGSSDVAYLFLVIFLAVAGMAHRIPQKISALDLSMVICGGAACLISLTPPKTTLTRTLVVAGMSFALWWAI